ncbi:MAG: hypothetical protein EOO38_21225 [Cytophagaceae bacterium]|nr:MAG: hypothetical protein EOO38_21225 [Cytophagaceae bacterium]
MDTSGKLTLQWQVVFSAGYTGTKTLWGYVQDAGTLVDGIRSQGTVTLVDPASSTRGLSAGNS